MKRYKNLKAWVAEILVAIPPTDTLNPTNWTIKPGPELPDIPGPYVLLTPYGGPGEDLEGAVDDRAWQVRVCGHQLSWEDAEEIANAIDEAFLRHTTSTVHTERVISVMRSGGPPSPLDIDDADRVHFVCSYIFGVGLGLVNQ